jgi:hypothetical protein
MTGVSFRFQTMSDPRTGDLPKPPHPVHFSQTALDDILTRIGQLEDQVLARDLAYEQQDSMGASVNVAKPYTRTLNAINEDLANVQKATLDLTGAINHAQIEPHVGLPGFLFRDQKTNQGMAEAMKNFSIIWLESQNRFYAYRDKLELSEQVETQHDVRDRPADDVSKAEMDSAVAGGVGNVHKHLQQQNVLTLPIVAHLQAESRNTAPRSLQASEAATAVADLRHIRFDARNQSINKSGDTGASYGQNFGPATAQSPTPGPTEINPGDPPGEDESPSDISVEKKKRRRKRAKPKKPAVIAA